ncbi:hypothetical protein GCK72_023177 [Caenorhabditis remanei]|uniref:Uncharacterized protein n=2 Tax=Caenorhabditis remanei TaxID=31234 RepID=A0A6A5FVP1_CAERE|nr:hypothetical protein GCK72_023177 [Caenorhabditis remanei]KAF1746720.1 hypothetical protein GCK72_023177 [Caenorhabditis remanei]
MHHFIIPKPKFLNSPSYIHFMETMKEGIAKEAKIAETSFFDKIYSPLVIFFIFAAIGCVIGLVNYIRNERHHKPANQRLFFFERL